MAKIEIGDIFEINTPKGKIYLHYIYKDERIGELIRVLPGVYLEKPDLLNLAAKKEVYMVFFPLAAAKKRKIVEQVGHFPANDFSKPKYMRSKHIVRGEFLGWHIVDTDTFHMRLVKSLAPEQLQLSPWGVANDAFLVDNVINDWTLEKWS
ncbi:putative uncharacterized protein [Parachlamydia acanthamoebae UV-7]|uniref:Uncharacterized protein n=2 Tax=Parachlamydia acanthamoebae TaxID=83552 RepID=F8KV45_PARAV|nr:hypothetical protein [Parachlamydia acanthamoebae]CCB85123.1 putative uncharacterized protein [Parachlamydia acanthamoebae UV-7]